ncbi:2-oxoglutarate dehydrogenase complex dihydrolipoyllysine-residue succinyltransferase [Plebeiibacterium sediminum]|uniref:Dihydrolipoyllysine-residue succinyltransferase n=1 Tax=Plebeiibacterium sediminum TaxID=2992112 RepID=A0AAE3M1Z1_9BACT|nr:2-oxoglutarate dehydrogenase complex dihydrolipoyllysine-residue succinyltransferase [Plebeiobacterium sediminum]MCW3785367.1 2-oxoglutarate dehydrogenase complex dihydrolipoyllysine-residue succinyltransferase [Plebeiobacterium sediminum]
MIIEIKVPSPGESITEVEIASWLVNDGDIVTQDQELAEIESDKATLTINADKAGKIKIVLEAGETVAVGEVACTIDTSVAPEEGTVSEVKEEQTKESPAVESKPAAKASSEKKPVSEELSKVKVSPVAQNIMEEEGWTVEDVINGLHRISKKEIQAIKEQGTSNDSANVKGISSAPKERELDRQKMSSLRKKLSARLVAVKQETAMLTTFNEVDMSEIMAMRKKYQNVFVEKHGVKLGFMSFFIKASALAMKKHPMVNSMIDGDEIVTPNYVDVSVAVQTPKGLMVPVIRNAESLSLAQIEETLKQLAVKARSGKISLDEMTGGTFTVTNGGVFGSMLSTPLINPPQSAILGMHNIVDRPMAVNGKVEIRPIMYTALSYDHRIIDGKDSVGFLVTLKKMLEKPELMLTGGDELERLVLDL